MDLSAGLDQDEIDARLRAGYGLTNWLSAGAELYADHRWGQSTEYGALVGLTASF